MIVTDYVDSVPLSDCPEEKNYLNILDSVDRALQLLHAEDLVSGDLRPQNIVLNPNEVKLINDFDFAGPHGDDRYPASFNTARHHEDVHRRGVVDKEHDIATLDKVRKFLKDANSAA